MPERSIVLQPAVRTRLRQDEQDATDRGHGGLQDAYSRSFCIQAPTYVAGTFVTPLTMYPHLPFIRWSTLRANSAAILASSFLRMFEKICVYTETVHFAPAHGSAVRLRRCMMELSGQCLFQIPMPLTHDACKISGAVGPWIPSNSLCPAT